MATVSDRLVERLTQWGVRRVYSLTRVFRTPEIVGERDPS
jgi:hypothetical protein